MKLSPRPLAALLGACLLAVSLQAEEIKLPNLMADAKVGDWVLYEVQGGIRMRQEVVEVTEDKLTLKVETIMNGQTISSINQPIPRTKGEYAKPEGELPEGMEKPVITTGTITVKGKTLKCWIVETTVEGQKSRAYLSQEVPINGLVKSELNGKALMQLVDYGRK